MEIILFNTAVGTSNLGDEIINRSALVGIEALIDNSFVIEYGSHLKNLGILHYLIKSTKVEYSERCDYKFVLGTNLLTSNIVRSIRQWPVGPISRLLYKECILMGVGTTYNNIHMDFFTKQLYEQILNKNIAHSVRDEKSKKLLESIKGISAINTGCPTLWGLTEEVCDKIPKEKMKNVVISLSGYSSQRDKLRDQIFIKEIEKNYEKVYFWVQTTEDEKYYSELSHRKEVQKIYSLKNFENVCRNANVDYVGTRLHGGIFAMQNNVRSIVIEIDHRAAGFKETNNIVTIKRENIDSLNELINSKFKTEIRIPEKEIKQWKKQFPYM